MSRRILTAALALSVAAVMGGATPASGGGGEFTTTVKIRDFRFKPRKVEIGQGTRVKWVNRGDEAHTVTSNATRGNEPLFASGELAPGEKFVRRFPKTGAFKYHCEIHPEMTGKVISADV